MSGIPGPSSRACPLPSAHLFCVLAKLRPGAMSNIPATPLTSGRRHQNILKFIPILVLLFLLPSPSFLLLLQLLLPLSPCLGLNPLSHLSLLALRGQDYPIHGQGNRGWQKPQASQDQHHAAGLGQSRDAAPGLWTPNRHPSTLAASLRWGHCVGGRGTSSCSLCPCEQRDLVMPSLGLVSTCKVGYHPL